MAYALVQSATFTGGPPTVTFTSTPAQGHLLRCLVFDQSSTTQPTVSDTVNGAWTLMNSNTRSSNTFGLWEFAVLAASSQPTTVTVSQGTDSLAVLIEEWSGNYAPLSGLKDQGVGSNGGTAQTTAGETGGPISVTTTGANDLVLTAVGWGGTVTSPAAPAGFTQDAAWPTSIKAASFYQIATGAGTFTPTVTWTTSRAFVHLVTAYFAQATVSIGSATIAGTLSMSPGPVTAPSMIGAATISGTLVTTPNAVTVPGGRRSPAVGGHLLGTHQLAAGDAAPPSTAIGSVTISGVLASGATISTVFNTSAAFAGTASMSAAGTLSLAGTAAFSGTGTMSATGAISGSGTATFSGVGTMAASGALTLLGAAAFGGAAAMSSTGSLALSGAAAFTGSGTMTSNGTVAGQYSGTAAFTASGSMTAAAVVELDGTAAFGGSSDMESPGVVVLTGSANFTADGSMTAAAAPTIPGTAAFTGTGTMAASGAFGQQLFGTAAFTADGSMVVAGTLSMPRLAAQGASSEDGNPTLEDQEGQMDEWPAGQLVTASVVFTDESTGDPYDPTTVSLSVLDPDLDVYSYSYPPAEGDPVVVVRTAAGQYRAQLDTTGRPGAWAWAFEGRVEADGFLVTKSPAPGYFIINRVPSSDTAPEDPGVVVQVA